MPEVKLDAGDAAELAEMLQFLTGWLRHDSGRLAAFAGRVRRSPRLRHPGPSRRLGAVCLPARRQRRRAPLRPGPSHMSRTTS